MCYKIPFNAVHHKMLFKALQVPIMSRRYAGFTLAEALIALGVIGVVAAVVIPNLMQNVQDYTFAKAKENSLQKITEATNEMKSNDVLAGYTTNSSFVDAFEKYMVVVKRCNSSNLAGCFPQKFKASDGSEIDVTTLTTGDKLGKNNIVDSTISLMLKNGTTMLFSLRDSAKVPTDCARIDPFNNTSNTTSCMSFLYDINGYGPPNTMGKDIGSISTPALACSGIRISDGTCFASAVTPTPMSLADCNAAVAAGTLGITACSYDGDYWAGAVAHCKGKSNLPSDTQLDRLADQLYNITGCPAAGSCGTALDYTKAVKAGFPSTGSFGVWSNYASANGTDASSRSYNDTSSNRWNTFRNNPSRRVVCIGE